MPDRFARQLEGFLAGLGPAARAGFLDRWRERLLENEQLAELLRRAARAAMDDVREPGTAVPGLDAEVGVVMDARGVAHVRAAGEADAYRAQGYLTARDRLWQMDLMRRVAGGRAAEVLGEPARESDRHFLVYGFANVARRAVAHLRADVRAALEAYAAGVNARIARFRSEGWPWEFTLLAYEPEPWTAADSLLVAKLQSEALSSSWLDDLLREQFADLPPELRAVLFDDTSPLDVIVFGSDDAPFADRARPAFACAPLEPPAAGREAAPAAEVVERKRTRAAALRLVSLYGRRRAASNNWVVSGARAAGGAPILANDPHLQVAVPGLWHMVHLAFGDTDFAGATIPGVPGILIGHNTHVAWGMTNVGADVQDLYLERIDPQRPGEYATADGPAPLAETRHTLRVRTPQGVQEETFVARATRHGPIVFETQGRAYALSWPALDPAMQDVSAFHDLARARNAAEVRAALSRYDGPAQAFVFATREGDIGAQIAGCVIERPSGAPGLPRDGATARDTAPARLAFERLPHVLNPPSGVIVTANNRTMGTSYPYLIAQFWAAPYRARRIFDLLAAQGPGGVAQSLAIQKDTFSFADWVFVGAVLHMARYCAVSDARWRAIIALLGDWDCSTTAGSVAATVSARMRAAFSRKVLQPLLGDERLETYLRWDNAFRFIDAILAERPLQWLPAGFGNYEEVVLAAFDDAVAELAARHGMDTSAWQWGAVSEPIVFEHPLAALAPQWADRLRHQLANGTGGAGPTVDAGAFVSMRFVADLADWDRTRLGLSLGQSGDVRSPHFADQLASWIAGDPPVFAFGQAAGSGTPLRLVPP